MKLPTRVRPRAFAVAFALAVLLGIGPGFVIGNLFGEDESSSGSEATSSVIRPLQAASPGSALDGTGPNTVAPPLECRFGGSPSSITKPSFVAGVVDGGMDALADAFDVDDRLSVERETLIIAAAADAFAQRVVEKGPVGVLLIQEGKNQRAIADAAKANAVVVVVLPIGARESVLAAYPSGTLGVFTSESSAAAAILTSPMAESVVQVLRGEMFCQGNAIEGDQP